MTKLIILDRDGVINQDSLHYIKSPEEFIFLSGSIEAIAKLTAAGYKIGVATNQSGISRGLYNKEQLAAIHEKLMQSISSAGGWIDYIEYCPHMPDSGCECRKPKPGMLQTIAKKFNTSLNDVPFVGDRVSDVEAALAVGAKPIMVLSPMTDRAGLSAYPEVPVYHSLLEFVEAFLAKDNAK
ncbi:D,D-heptose 1,7-bisphosphate phosphatase [Legionella adelaidensis]|uniref:D,D-heptose 1,7-bisphosphate phosphatase n=1 Tax=Legionella adelaidensis TaxID=45056 RepID=A0A0W0R3F3_9GAMM|nr:D-glycero-beta-D-manno-heptose 1,7-bisphosphate 7-phosphatase [Legionella adelaidensis]KTC65564.1 D,D-heptose 1,7-bisphosphate phosphatase [Legionella adelaidensis]